MRRVIVDRKGNLSHGQVCAPGEEFDIYEGEDAYMKWCDLPDDVVLTDTVQMHNGEYVETHVVGVKKQLDSDRMHAYGGVEDQLDMMYHDKMDGTTTWEDHVANVKATVTAPSTANVDFVATTDLDRPEPQWEKID